MIKEIGNQTIDFSKIDRVGALIGDPLWLRYTIYFSGGNILEVYEKRKYADNYNLLQMKRIDFISLWKKQNE